MAICAERDQICRGADHLFSLEARDRRNMVHVDKAGAVVTVYLSKIEPASLTTIAVDFNCLLPELWVTLVASRIDVLFTALLYRGSERIFIAQTLFAIGTTQPG